MNANTAQERILSAYSVGITFEAKKAMDGRRTKRGEHLESIEHWKPIKGYEGLYEVSDHGRIRSLDRVGYQRHYSGKQSKYIHKGQFIKPYTDKRGYQTLHLRKNGDDFTVSVHRLVGLHFLDKPEGKDCINHRDANPSNNHVSNLEWCTQSENIQYAYDHGTKRPPHLKPIGQYDDDWNLIKVWEGETAAARALGTHQANIMKVCYGEREHAGGFRWKFMKQQ